MKENCYSDVKVFTQANLNGTICYLLGQRRNENGENGENSSCLLLIPLFLSRLCNISYSQLAGVLRND